MSQGPQVTAKLFLRIRRERDALEAENLALRKRLARYEVAPVKRKGSKWFSKIEQGVNDE